MLLSFAKKLHFLTKVVLIIYSPSNNIGLDSMFFNGSYVGHFEIQNGRREKNIFLNILHITINLFMILICISTFIR